MSGVLSREQILGVADRKTEELQVDEWGGTVRIAVMTGNGRDEFLKAVGGGVPNAFFEAKLLVLTLVDSGGAPLFTDDDVAAIQAKSADVMARLALEAMRVNGLGKGAVDAAVGNSESSQSNNSGTDSPLPSVNQ